MRTNKERTARAGKPWLERAAGECAFPVAGEGAQVRSCAAPVERGGYCRDHRLAMFRPADPEEARALLRLAETLERRTGGRR